MAFPWGFSPAGAAYAIRNLLRANIPGQIAVKNAALLAQVPPINYVIPDVPTNRIRLRLTRQRTIPKHLPQVLVTYMNRRITDTASFGVGESDLQVLISFWFTMASPDFDNDLDAEEVLKLSSMDMCDIITKSLRRSDNVIEGIYGKADGSLLNVEEEDNPLRAAYLDKNSKTYTIEGRVRLRFLQTAEY